MKNFKDGKREGGFRGGNKGGFEKKSWGGAKSGGYGADRDRQMFKAVCAGCGKPCEVPFRPTGDKPVFCSDCFSKKRDEGGEHREERTERRDYSDRAPKRDFGDRHAPRPDAKPAYSPAPSNDETKKQLMEIGMKLDRLINAVERMTAPKAEPKKVEVETPAPKKVVAKKVVAKKEVVKKVAPAAKKKVASKKK
jgi:CxxC-x17-CxxC domain-containing protein